MAPPEQPFPVSQLETRVLSYTQNYKEKSRKLPRDFDLKRDCELFELVQFTCTTMEQQRQQVLKNPDARAQVDCFPFVRLFRRCGKGDKMFNVETTAWEGEHAWKRPTTSPTNAMSSEVVSGSQSEIPFAKYGSYFWSNK